MNKRLAAFKFIYAFFLGAVFMFGTANAVFAQTYPQRVSLDPEETHQFVGSNDNSTISAYGRYIVFGSYSSSLVPDDTNNVEDAFVHDMLTGSTTRVSLATDGTQADGGTLQPTISTNGRYVTFD